MRDRPCRQFCNRSGCSETKCLGAIFYRRDDPRFWLGRGQESVPGKPFGWAHAMERQAIREHLKAKGRWDRAGEFRVSAIQQRLQREYHRRKPPVGLVQNHVRSIGFTAEEMAHIAEHFAGANDPVAQSIWQKASERLTAP